MGQIWLLRLEPLRDSLTMAMKLQDFGNLDHRRIRCPTSNQRRPAPRSCNVA